MSTRTRHWKQRFDPDAPLVFLKRLRIGDDPQRPFVLPGDPVTDELKKQFGVNRLAIWWKGGFIGRADFDPTVRGGVVKKSQTGIEHTGRGWYMVTFEDGTSKKVRGEENAKMELALRVNAPALRAALGS